MLEIVRVSPHVDTNGTALRGYIETSYQELESILGEPTFTDYEPEEKVACEWSIELDNGTVCTIYSWKTEGRVPYGEYRWHVGARKVEAFDHLLEALEDAGIEVKPTRA